MDNSQESLNETQTLQIPSNLLKSIRHQSKDVLAQKYKFENIGTNGFIEIEPKVLKFAGFEVGKLNILKVKVINASTRSQRVHILPPTSPFFSIKFDKKGLIAAGNSEDIYVQFKPIEYKYYYDAIRVHTEDEQLQIPIHAYPVLDRNNLREIFPKLIDFGKVPIGTTQTIRFPLQSKIPLNFEFEFVFTKEDMDIKITPRKGIIPGKSTTEIEISYTPSKILTVQAECKLTLSQFDFEPLLIKILGSGSKGRMTDGESTMQKNTMRSSRIKLQKLESGRLPDLKGDEKDLFVPTEDGLVYKSLMGQTAKLREEGQVEEAKKEKNFSIRVTSIRTAASPMLESIKSPEKTQDLIETAPVLSERQLLEKAFIDRFNKFQQTDKDKMIKFFQCVGDAHVTEDETHFVDNERRGYMNNFLENYEKKGVTRYKVKQDEGLPEVGEIIPHYSATYDTIKNDVVRKRRKILEKFMLVASKIIIRYRAEGRFQKIKTYIKGCDTKEKVRKFVEQDWERAEYFGMGKKDYIAFKFEFNRSKVTDSGLPIQYESSANSLNNFRFELEQKVGFDDFVQIDPFAFNDAEIMGYKPIQVPSVISYAPMEVNRGNRTCAEEEALISGPMGPIEKLEDVRFVLDNVPSNMLKPFEVKSHKFITPHPVIRKFVPLLEVTETDPEFKLQPKQIEFQDSLDPAYPSTEEERDLIYREYLASAPGMEGIRALGFMPLEFSHHYIHKLALAPDFAFEQKWEKYCPDLLANPQEEDRYSDGDSDDNNSVDMNVPDTNDFISMLESEDKTMQMHRKREQSEIFDERENTLQILNGALENEKEMWISVLPSKIYGYNKQVHIKKNTLIIQ